MKKLILFAFAALMLQPTFYSCGDKHQTPPWQEPEPPEKPQPPETPDGKKEKMLWLDADENFATNFATRESTTALLDRIKAAGFNKIVVDVRPAEGNVLYNSSFMPLYGGVAERGYDYLQFMLDEAKKRGMKVTVSAVIFGAGFMKDAVRDPSKGRTRGVAWSDPELAKLVCQEYVPGKKFPMNTMEDTAAAKDARRKGAGSFIFLNPAHPDVQAYVLRFIEEIVTKYDFDAFALDYCRFPDSESDFSDFSRGEFEKFIGTKVSKWPEDIFGYNPDGSHIKGKHYYDWWRWRATVIHDVIERIRIRIKELKPDMRIEYWAGSWLSQDSGQNWASPSYNLTADHDSGWYYSQWMKPEYSKTGFADLLDTFLLGTYMTDTYEGPTGPDGYTDPNPDTPPMESLEYQIERGYRYVGKACTMYGNVVGTNTPAVAEEQIYYCLKHSEGVMVFDLCHFVNAHNDGEAHFAAFKRGIDRAEKELAEQAARSVNN
jgi:hypothetical protein